MHIWNKNPPATSEGNSGEGRKSKQKKKRDIKKFVAGHDGWYLLFSGPFRRTSWYPPPCMPLRSPTQVSSNRRSPDLMAANISLRAKWLGSTSIWLNHIADSKSTRSYYRTPGYPPPWCGFFLLGIIKSALSDLISTTTLYEVAGPYVYPIKSCRGFQVNWVLLRMQALDLDRQWMFVDANTRAFFTIREQ